MKRRISAVMCCVILIVSITGCSKNEADDLDVIAEEEAKEKALTHAGVTEDRVTFTSVRLEKEDGQTYYDVSFYGGGIEYDYDIDAVNGNIIEFEQDQETSVSQNIENVEDIGEEKAKQIAVERIPGVDSEQITIQKEEDDDKPVYKGNFVYEGKEYEFEIDALTGDVLDWEEETL